MPPILTTVEFGFKDQESEEEFLKLTDRAEREVRDIQGCLDYRLYHRDGRCYLFFVVWEDAAAIDRWVSNEFHQKELMPSFRKWCNEGWFGYWGLGSDRNRAKKCLSCGRWTQEMPGWDQNVPSKCRQCGLPL